MFHFLANILQPNERIGTQCYREAHPFVDSEAFDFNLGPSSENISILYLMVYNIEDFKFYVRL